jgi:ATP-dependent Clp protease ATP-binding subunit ClpA
LCAAYFRFAFRINSQFAIDQDRNYFPDDFLLPENAVTYLQEAQNQMRPEIFDRFDRVLVFNRLSYEVQIDVGRLHLSREIEMQKHRGYRVREWDAEALKAIVRNGYSEKQGARRMRNAAREAVQEAIRDALLSGKEASGRLHYDGQMKAFFLNGQS